jgi:hypothetical protein
MTSSFFKWGECFITTQSTIGIREPPDVGQYIIGAEAARNGTGRSSSDSVNVVNVQRSLIDESPEV